MQGEMEPRLAPQGTPSPGHRWACRCLPRGLGCKEPLTGAANWRLPPPAGVFWCGSLVRGHGILTPQLLDCVVGAQENGRPLFPDRLWDWLNPAPPASCAGAMPVPPPPGEAAAGRGPGTHSPRPRLLQQAPYTGFSAGGTQGHPLGRGPPSLQRVWSPHTSFGDDGAEGTPEARRGRVPHGGECGGKSTSGSREGGERKAGPPSCGAFARALGSTSWVVGEAGPMTRGLIRPVTRRLLLCVLARGEPAAPVPSAHVLQGGPGGSGPANPCWKSQ